jgi:putative acetyltransferase
MSELRGKFWLISCSRMRQRELPKKTRSAAKSQIQVAIRLMKPDEIGALLQLLERSIRKLNTQDYNTAQIEAIISTQPSAFEGKTVTFVAEYESNIVGFAVLAHVGIVWQINSIFIEPDFARQGVGKRLIAALEQEAARQKASRLYVASSLTAIGFYKNMGYRCDRQVLLTMSGVKIPTVYMIKALSTFHWFYGLIVLAIAIILLGILVARLF